MIRRLSGTSKPQSPSINDEGHINLGRNFIIFQALMIDFVVLYIECCLAYNDGSSEPMKLTQNDFNHYKIVFIDMLVNSNQLTLDPKPIGEGKSCEFNILCTFRHIFEQELLVLCMEQHL